MSPRWRDVPRAIACAALAWLVIGALRGEISAHIVVGFAVLGLLPLGLALSLENGTDTQEDDVPLAYRLCVTMMPGLLLGGFFLFWGGPGTLPATMAAGAIAWFSLCAALLGLQRWMRRERKGGPELAIDFALWMLPFAALWLFASRLGVTLLGVREPGVLRTAEWWLHAGFAAPLLFGALGRHVRGKLVKPYRVATAFACAAMPLILLGAGLQLEVIAAVLLALGMLLGAVVIAGVGWSSPGLAKPLLLVSAGALAALTAVVFLADSDWRGVLAAAFLGAGLLGASMLDASSTK